MGVSRTESQVEGVDPTTAKRTSSSVNTGTTGGIADGLMQSLMNSSCPTSNIADFMAPDNGNYGSAAAVPNPKSVTRNTPPASTARKSTLPQ